MNYVTITYHAGSYAYAGSTSREMDVLGIFLASDIGLRHPELSSLKKWALADKKDTTDEFGYGIGGNTTYLEEDYEGNIHLIDIIGNGPDEPEYVPATIKMTKQQFIQLLDDWHEKVYKLRPQKVIVTYENDQFTIKTED